MPKYRILTSDELMQLEKIFINFLTVNSITSDEWTKIMSSNKEKMNSLIEEFSDVVFEKTLSNIKFLENRHSKKILMYKFNKDHILLEGIEIENETSFDFRDKFSLEQLNGLFTDENIKISFIIGNKPYFEDPKKEAFDLMESGAMISQNKLLFDLIVKLREKYSESE